MSVAPRVFISYSTLDRELVEAIQKALVDAGVAVWLDHERLTPGTPNWQVAVRNGISQSTVVVYAASPSAAVSPYVIDELSLARGDGKSVIPFWVRGDKWHECVPLGFGTTQYTDGRGSNLRSGLAALLQTLGLPAQAGPSAQPVASPAPLGAPRPILKRLNNLGYSAQEIGGVEVILPPLCPVPAGPFTMGSDKARDPQAFADETPQYVITVGAYQIGMYPVTVAEYACAVRAKAVPEPPKGGIVWKDQMQRLDHPVDRVSWQDAVAYATWLAKVTRQSWRLPSEAEWEKAARGADGRIYPWGNAWDKARANTNDGGPGGTTPVAAYAERGDSSPYGAHDLSGNVFEWTSSLFKPYPYIVSDGREASNSAENRVVRGSSWDIGPRYARAACRFNYAPSDLAGYKGFRLAVAAPSSV